MVYPLQTWVIICLKSGLKESMAEKVQGSEQLLSIKEHDKAIFLYGFGKNEKENISNSELQYFKKLGNDLLVLNKEQLKQFIERNVLFDIEVAK